MANTSVLWYTSPAKAWTQSLPIGNGILGAMIYGGVEKISSASTTTSSGQAHPETQSVRVLPRHSKGSEARS